MKGNPKGYTIIEVVAVLVLMSVLLVVFMSRWTQDSSAVVGRSDALKSHLRYAQLRAMNTTLPDQDIVWGLYFPSASQYYLFSCNNTADCVPSTNRRVLPGSDTDTVDISTDNVSVTSPLTVAFNRLGRPYTDAALTTSQAGTVSITLQDGAGTARTVSLTAETGFVP
jgi:prepilin-type N-terminal cleavage/methylation domain-containing protein